RDGAAQGREQPLRAEGLERGRVGRVEVAEVGRRRLAGAGVGGRPADLEPAAGRGQHRPAGGGGVEEVPRQVVGGGAGGGDGVPVDLPPAGGGVAADVVVGPAQVGAELGDGGGDAGRVRPGG